jgi:hypothetical protein
MVITIAPELEAALRDAARRRGILPETLANEVLCRCLLAPPPMTEPRDDWERQLREAASDCGVSLSNEALSSEGIYD